MWLNELGYQQLLLRFDQLNKSLNVANATCTHLQNDLAAQREELMEVKQQYAIINTSLKHEFKCHEETEKSLTHERNVTRGLVKLVNNFDLPESLKSNLLPENFQLGVLFRENQDMRQRLYDSNDEMKTLNEALESKQDCIKVLEAEKISAVAELEEKIRRLTLEFLNFMTEVDDISIETATVGKRKRASICSVGCIE